MFKKIFCLFLLLFLCTAVFAQKSRTKKQDQQRSLKSVSSATHFPNFLPIRPDKGIYRLDISLTNDRETSYYLFFINNNIKLTEKSKEGPEILCDDYSSKYYKKITLTEAVYIDCNIFRTSSGYCAIGIGVESDRPPRLIFIKFSSMPIKINFDAKGVVSVAWIDTNMFEAKHGATMSIQNYPWSYQRRVLGRDAQIQENDKSFKEALIAE